MPWVGPNHGLTRTSLSGPGIVGDNSITPVSRRRRLGTPDPTHGSLPVTGIGISHLVYRFILDVKALALASRRQKVMAMLLLPIQHLISITGAS